MTPKAKEIEDVFVQMADPEKRKILMRFFKTGPGQYGEGDQFLGVKNPETRKVVKLVWKDCSLYDAADLVHSKWHEVRLCGLLILVELFACAQKKKEDKEMTSIYQQYIDLYPFINNWDLVDLSAYKIVGHYEMLHPEEGLMDSWITPSYTLWQQRIAMVSTWQHVRYNHFSNLLYRAEVLLSSQEDLLQKAAGWMLRELYSHDEIGQDLVRQFLDDHVAEMPSVMLSYTTEKMSQDERRYWRSRRGK